MTTSVRSNFSNEILVEALFDLAEDISVDPVSSPTVLVLGHVESYHDKVPSEYAEAISGKQVDSFQGIPIKQFNPRYAYTKETEEALVLGDGHLGEERYSDLPVEFEHKLSTEDYVVAVIYQEKSEDTTNNVRVSSIGELKM